MLAIFPLEGARQQETFVSPGLDAAIEAMREIDRMNRIRPVLQEVFRGVRFQPASR